MDILTLQTNLYVKFSQPSRVRLFRAFFVNPIEKIVKQEEYGNVAYTDEEG